MSSRRETDGPPFGATGICLRVAAPSDGDFLFATYASARADELAVVPWTSDEKGAFLRQQFDAQCVHYRAHYPGSEEFVVELNDERIGRLYVDRTANEIRVMDIALLPEHRSKGIGGALLGELLAEAAAADRAVTLHVEADNPARRLYARLGFVEIEKGSVYDLLEWRPPRQVSAS